MLLRHLAIACVLSALLPGSALGGKADVEKVTAQKGADGLYTFNVTVRHGDEGWEHYANRWDVVGPDGTVLGTRVLLHPHVDEQPFTRSLRGVEIPSGVKSVVIRAHDSVHKLGGAEVKIELE